ncbi:MAG: hypothetical protein AAF327_24685 [Cyanobacteria bacterium P01_A01_bin.37]
MTALEVQNEPACQPLACIPMMPIYKKIFIEFLLLCFVVFFASASGKGNMVFLERIKLEFTDVAISDYKIYLELEAPISLGRILYLTVGDGERKSTLLEHEFRLLGMPDLKNVSVTNSANNKDVIYVEIPFRRNSINDPKFKDKRCRLSLVLKNFKYQYQQISAEHEGVLYFLYHVYEKNRTNADEVSFTYYSNLSDNEKSIIEETLGD